MLELLYLFHVLATVIWVGGMFFAHQCLRPVALAQLELPQRLKLWRGVFSRFFPWVWLSIITLIASGIFLINMLGGMANVPVHAHIMASIGYVMTAIFAYLYFVPFKALKQHVDAEDWSTAGAALNRIRSLVGINLTLGLLNVVLVFVLPRVL